MPVFVFAIDEIGHQVDAIERKGYTVTAVIPNPPLDDDVERYMVFAHLTNPRRIETRGNS